MNSYYDLIDCYSGKGLAREYVQKGEEADKFAQALEGVRASI